MQLAMLATTNTKTNAFCNILDSSENLKAKNNNIRLPGTSGIKSIPYHTVIAKKKGPHTVGTVLRRRGRRLLRPRRSLLAPPPCAHSCDARLLKPGCTRSLRGPPNRLFKGYFDSARQSTRLVRRARSRGTRRAFSQSRVFTAAQRHPEAVKIHIDDGRRE